MSDEEEYLSEESYEFEFEDDDEDVDSQNQTSEGESPENQYYYAKGLKEDSLEEATAKFKFLIDSANAKMDSEWIFKAHKQLAKIHYRQQVYELVLKNIEQLMLMLPYLNGNYAEESISKILTRYSACSNHTFVKNLFDVVVNHLQDFISSGSSGHRLWLKININRLNNLLESDDLSACNELIDSINERLGKVSESTKNSYALEIIAAEIAFTMRTSRDPVKLSTLYCRSLEVSPAITHPQVMGVIRECGATVQFFKGNYDKARVDFYECFKNYDEAGSSSKNKVLKYLIICCLLVESEVNPFESQETQSYAQLPEYGNLIDLVEAYEKLDLNEFIEIETRMKQSQDPLSEDPLFVASHMLIINNLKVKMLSNYAKAYRTLRFDFVIDRLCLKSDDDLEQLLVEMANSGMLSNFRINFAKRFVDFGTGKGKSIFLSTVDEKKIRKNARCLYRLSFVGPWQPSTGDCSSAVKVGDGYDDAVSLNALLEEDQLPQSRENCSNVFETLFGASALQIDTTPDQEEWLNYMKSAIPKKKIGVSSQKDQVILEQREESEEKLNHSEENDEALANTNTGILGSSINYAVAPVKTSKDEETRDKLYLLHDWAHQLSKAIRQH